jgi:hypothetical protein
MRTVVIALAATAVLIAPAHAQMRGGKGGGKQQSAAQQQESAEKKQKAAAAEKAYKAALDRIPDQKYDPWAHKR